MSTGQQSQPQSLVDALREVFVGQIVPFPVRDGLVVPSASRDNPIEVDLREGRITIPGVDTKDENVNTLNRLDERNAITSVLLTDADVGVRTLNHDRELTGRFRTGGLGYTPIQNTETAILELVSDTPFYVTGQFSTAVNGLTLPRTETLTVEKFGYQNPTQDSLTAVPMVPSTPDTVSNLDVDDIETAVDQYGNGEISGHSVSQHTWVVANTGANDITVQVVGEDRDGEQTIADTDIHAGPSLTNTVTVGSGDTAVLESGLQLAQRRVRAANATGGNDSSVRVQYLGQSPGLR